MSADINLIIQVISFVLILIGIVYKIKKKFKIHGFLMGLALVLHIAFFIYTMWPSFSLGYDYFTSATSLLGVQAMWIHAVPGTIALILGLFLVIAWLFKISNIAACFKRKRLMDITLVLWLISLIFGIVTYFGLHV